MKISKHFWTVSLSLLALLVASSQASAASTSGSITVSLTIIDVGQSTAQGFSSNPTDYTGGRYISALTTAADGETVGIYLNGQKVASAISNKGVINFAVNAKDTSQVNLSLQSKGREVQVIQAAYRSRKDAPVPQMTLDPQIRHMQIGNETVPVQSVIISY